MNITLVGRSELGNQRKDIRCAEEQFFKQLIQFSKSVLDIKTGLVVTVAKFGFCIKFYARIQICRLLGPSKLFL